MNSGFEPYLLDHPWILSLIWMVLYTSDYYLSLANARLYKRQNYYKVEGSFELTPFYQKDIENENKFSVRFLTMLLLFATWIYVIASYLDVPKFGVGILVGFFIMPEMETHVRHIQNTMLFRKLASSNPGATGQLTMTLESGYKKSATQLACYCSLMLVIFILTGSPMVLGGAIAFLLLALRHISLAKRCTKTTTSPANKENTEQTAAKDQS